LVNNGLGISVNYLRRTTSGAAGNGLSRFQELLMCPFTASALDFPCSVRGSFANKQNDSADSWGLGAQCFCVEIELSSCVHNQNPQHNTFSFASSGSK
jgi:hypothetical protein